MILRSNFSYTRECYINILHIEEYQILIVSVIYLKTWCFKYKINTGKTKSVFFALYFFLMHLF